MFLYKFGRVNKKLVAYDAYNTDIFVCWTTEIIIMLRSLYSLTALCLLQAQETAADETPIIQLSPSLFIVNEPVPFASAENACLQAGGSLAGMAEKSADVEALLLEKSAAGSTAYWMKSHEVNQWDTRCVQFNVLEKSTIPITGDCSQLLPVLCEKAANHNRRAARVCRKPCGCADRFNCDVCDYPSSSSSSSSESTDSDCCTCPNEECVRDYIEDMDFYTNFPRLVAPNKSWSYYVSGNTTADGGSLGTGCRGGFLDTKVYKVTAPQTTNPYSDHYKYFISADEPVAVPKSGNLVFEFLAGVKTFKTEQNPFPDVLLSDAADDVRLANGAFQVYETTDPLLPSPNSDGLVFSFYQTNDRVYIGYERQWLGTLPPEYATFSFLIPVKVRRSCDLHDMKIVINYSNRMVSWRLDGREVFRVTKVGYLLNREFMLSDMGGAEGDAFPELLKFGFGSFTLLDNYPGCLRSDVCRSCKFPDLRQALVQTSTDAVAADMYNPVLGSPIPAVFWDTQSLAINRLWGQGSETVIRRLAVYKEDCGNGKH